MSFRRCYFIIQKYCFSFYVATVQVAALIAPFKPSNKVDVLFTCSLYKKAMLLLNMYTYTYVYI